MIKDSRSPTDVQRKTEGMKKTPITAFCENLPTNWFFSKIYKSKYKLIDARNIERKRTERKSATPSILRILAGKYTIQRNIVGAVIHPLPDCADVPIGNVYTLLKVYT